MHIAVCDDDKIILDQISGMLDDYIDKASIDITYEKFESYAPVTERMDEFDIFLLDYRMDDISRRKGEMNGMEFARRLREKKGKAQSIIFITSYSEFVYEAFEVRAHRFLTKPINKDKLFEALDDYICSTLKDGTIIVKVNDDSHVINISDIYYLEVSLKNTFIHLRDKSLRCHRTISSFEEELAPYGFTRIHRSFIVNTAHVKTYNKKAVTLYNGTKIFISPQKYDSFCALMLRKPITRPHDDDNDFTEDDKQ